MNITSFCVPPDHPAACGHFPGNPIVPGAVLLNATLQAIEVVLGANMSSCQIRSAKFFRPARPGDKVTVEYLSAGAGDIRFSALIDGKTVLAGHVQCDLQLTSA
jgi:3-hydroxymyristoyl/3-hydroxydecanoyl-(acyl carrier protein) dehydratase